MSQPPGQQRVAQNGIVNQSFLNLQGNLNFMLQSICIVLRPDGRRLDDKRVELNKRMQAGGIPFADTLDRLEDDLNRARAVLRRDYARFKNEQARQKREELENKEKHSAKDKSPPPQDIEMIDTSPSDPIATVVDESSTLEEKDKQDKLEKQAAHNTPEATASEPPKKDTLPDQSSANPLTTPQLPDTAEPSTTDEPAELDIDTMLKELANEDGDVDPPTTTADENIDMDLGTFADSNDDVTSLIPGLESYTDGPDSGAEVGATSEEKDGEAPEQKQKDLILEDADDLGGLEITDSKFDELFNFDRMDFGETGDDGENGNEGNLDMGDFMTF